MTTAVPHAATRATRSEMGWLARAEAWLDDKGKPAWIVAMILGFIFFWPIGLALLFYMIWSKRMFNGSCSRRHSRHHRRHGEVRFDIRAAGRPSGNTAFDAYKDETLRRLQDEQDQFEAFLQRLRDAKDKTEFDAFMQERAHNAAQSGDDADDADSPVDLDDPVEQSEPKKKGA